MAAVTILLVFVASLVQAQEKATPLADIVAAAIQASESLKAQKLAEIVAQDRIAVKQTGYFPTFHVEGINSIGFPGSSGATDVTGVMISPYRSGWSYGLVGSQTVWDFGKTSREMGVAKSELAAEETQTRVRRAEVTSDAVGLYFACARTVSQEKLFTTVESQCREVERETEKFVRTGQRSVVERLLAKAQTDEATRAKLSAAQTREWLLARLAVLTGLAASAIECPDLQDHPPPPGKTIDVTDVVNNPYLRRAKAETELAQSKIKTAQAGYLPKVMVAGSLGDMQDNRLVKKENYAAAVGVIVPLMDGLKTPRQVDEARAHTAQKEAEERAVRQSVSDTNLKFDQVHQSAKIEIDRLRQEIEDSRRAFELARQRYLQMSGSLVDLRESVRNFAKLRAQFIETLSDWHQSAWSKLAFNGKEF